MNFDWFLNWLNRLDGLTSTADTIAECVGFVPSWLLGFLFLSLGVAILVGIINVIIDLI